MKNDTSQDQYNEKQSHSDMAEAARNGGPINWKDWASRQEITPNQAAKLAHFIDPITWPDNKTHAQGAIPDDLRVKIQYLTEWLAERSQSWTLHDLMSNLEDPQAPYGAKQAVGAMLGGIYAIQEEEKQIAGRYTLEEAAKIIAENTGEREKSILRKLVDDTGNGLLMVYAPGEKLPREYDRGKASVVREFYEQAYWDELNSWIKNNLSRIDFQFPEPNHENIESLLTRMTREFIEKKDYCTLDMAAEIISLHERPDLYSQSAMAGDLYKQMHQAAIDVNLESYNRITKTVYRPAASENVIFASPKAIDKWLESVKAPYRLTDILSAREASAINQTTNEHDRITWQEHAREIADEFFDKDTSHDVRDRLIRKNSNGGVIGGYAFRVMEEMIKRKIHGPRGPIKNPATISREALQGDKWWAKKPK